VSAPGTARDRFAAPVASDFAAEVRRGLSRPVKSLSPKWLYDARGSALFELITEQPEYYPPATELGIMERNAAAFAEAIGPEALLFEYGAGSAAKTIRLLAALDRPAGYVPVDISAEFLGAAALAVRDRFPGLAVRPVVADFTRNVPLPLGDLPCARRVSFFPGSTIGNFDPPEAKGLLGRMAADAGPGGALLLGVDLRKSEEILVPAYDDARGVTAAFDLNLLERMNRELGGDFRVEAFRHRAVWNAERSRVEMHLVAQGAQVVHVAGETFTFRDGETIHTESSYKWEPAAFDALAAGAGWATARTWTDERGWFAVKLFGAG